MLGGFFFFLLFLTASCQEGLFLDSDQVEQIAQQPAPTSKYDNANFIEEGELKSEVKAVSASFDPRLNPEYGTKSYSDNNDTKSSLLTMIGNLLPSFSEYFYGPASNSVKKRAIRDDQQNEQESPGVSLAFVFDSTGSMSDELSQVKIGAIKILAALLEKKEVVFNNFILVPFKDANDPVTVTTDPKKFQREIDSISVHGGGDCPEHSLTALLTAIELARPKSYFYVFTDARPEDDHLLTKITSLIQRKVAQVVFILTGACSTGNDDIYTEIAASSSGQVLRLSKSEVSLVLDFIKMDLNPNRVNLLSLNLPAPQKNTMDNHSVVVDETLKQLTVALSGKNSGILVSDPEGVSKMNSPDLERFLTLADVKIVSIHEPVPGLWQLSVLSESSYSLRATGRSTVSFRHGFSSVPTGNMDETNLRPLQGASCYLVVQVSDSAIVHNLTNVVINSLNGTQLKQLALTPHPTVPGTFFVANFTPPADFFHLEMAGFGKDGFPIHRITTTAISSSLPEVPIITMKNRTRARVNSEMKISCHVLSLVPFTVTWYKDDAAISPPINHSQTHLVELSMPKVSEKSEGVYTCKAENARGFRQESTRFSVFGSPPLVNTSNRVVAMVDDVIELLCEVTSDFLPTVVWTQFSTKNNYSGILHPILNGQEYNNNSLIIQNVTVADEGWFVCSAESKAGSAQSRTFLEVRDPLRVSVSPTHVAFTKDESKKLKCLAGGRPTPSVHWRFDSEPIPDGSPNIYLEELNGELNLTIDFLNKEHAGIYSCVAENSEDSVYAQVELVYVEKPTINARANSVVVRLLSEAVLTCEASGTPGPEIFWKRGDQIIEKDSHFEPNNGTLRIPVVAASDAGEFTCVARSCVGQAMDHIGLFVGHPPTFIQKPRDKKIQYGHNGTIFCIVMGSPPPDILWSRADGEVDSQRMITLVNGALRIINASVDDAGRYVCQAENQFGNISAEVVVKVTGTEKPKVDKSFVLSLIRVVPGAGVGIPCGVSLGNPPGEMTWLKDGFPILKNESSISEDGTLELDELAALSGGNYTCYVENPLGNVSRTYLLDVMEGPHVQENQTELERKFAVKLGNKMVLPCPVAGNPRPKITWAKQGRVIKFSTLIYQDVNDSLVLNHVNESFGGLYTCTGTNELGSTSAELILQILVPPQPVNGVVIKESPKEVVEGYVVVFDCQMYAVPAPNVSWFKDDNPIFPDDLDYTSQVLRFVASVDDGGVYKCVVSNTAGSAFKEFRLDILVPPRIIDPGDEPQVAKAGSSVTLRCGVTGVPTPEILWRRHGTYLNVNSSEITISGMSIFFNNISGDAGGAYVCEAENTAGIVQQTFYLHVTFPPRIVEEGNKTSVLVVRAGDEFSIPCAAEGSPQPDVGWIKDGITLHPYAAGVILHPDNTLVFLQVREEHAGVYHCYANNSEGIAEREYRLQVVSPPSMLTDIPNRIEVNEGEMLSLVCPASASPAPIIQWMKDGQSIGMMNKDRGDEPPLRLSVDRRQLLLAEAHPTDSGNYSCIAVNSAGRTDATFFVAVLMTPHFEEFNHIARRVVLVGGYVSLNCTVSGNPPPLVTWRKDLMPVLPGRPPGVLVSRDQFHLVVPSARLLHTGTFTCMATNKISSKEREFYVTVLEPPKIAGEGLENLELLLEERLALECPAAGEPKPQISWYAEYCDGTKEALNVTDTKLIIDKVNINDSAVYSCDAVSTAGTASKRFNVTILVPPEIEGNEMIDNVVAAEGENISLKCMIRGQPRPKVTWLHNGLEVDYLNKRRKRQSDNFEDGNRDEEMVATLTLNHVDSDAQGLYTALASNRAGVSNKNFRVIVAETPRVITSHESQKVVVLVGHSTVLTCPIEASPPPNITWHFPTLSDNERFIFKDNGRKIEVLRSTVDDTGNWTCVGANPAGQATAYVVLHVLEPPSFPDGNKEILRKGINDQVVMNCTSKGSPIPAVSWAKNGIALAENNSSLFNISALAVSDAGEYTCLARNLAGAAEKSITLTIYQPPVLTDELYQKEQFLKKFLNDRLELKCPFDGHPTPYVTWYKDDQKVFDHSSRVIQNSNQLVILSAFPDSSGTYKCVAENVAGKSSITFHVAIYVLASWSDWTDWSECSVTCGSGIQERQRFCNFTTGDLIDELLVDKTNCVGNSTQSQICGADCPIDGGWGNWSEWGACSVTCGGGTKLRIRQCSNPITLNGGKPCVGSEVETEECNKTPCTSGGKWLPWGEWSSCSATCGKGVRRRSRFCKPFHPKPCKDKVQMEFCHGQPCSASLQIKGTFNGQPIDSEVTADLTGNRMEAKLALDKEATWFPYAPLLLAPVAWNSATEEGSAANGFSLTRGRFLSQSEVSFDSGQGLSVRTEGRGVSPEGQMTVEIEVAGEAPVFEPAATLHIKSMEQDFIQVGDNMLMGLSKDILVSGHQKVPFRVNSSVSYGNNGRKMPYLAEKFKIDDIQNDESGLGFSANTSISPIPDKICPPGFIHDQQHMHCSDVDECLSQPCPFGQICINSWGSFECSCRDGYVSDKNGRCIDENECEDLEPRCSHSCTNTDGSFYCFCSTGYSLAPDGSSCLGEDSDEPEQADNNSSRRLIDSVQISCPSGFSKEISFSWIPSCQDIDECKMNPGICGEDGICLNTPGSFQCLDISCPLGFTREMSSRSCYAECDFVDCPHNSKIAETIIFQLLTLVSAKFRPYEDLVHLEVEENSAVWRQSSRIVEGNALRLRTADNQAYLYAPFSLKPKTLYRVVAQVKSLGPSDEPLFNTDFVIFVTLDD